MVTSLLMTRTSIEADFIIGFILRKFAASIKISTSAAKTFSLLKCVLYIYHPMRFKKNQDNVQGLLDFCNKVNVMTPAYKTKLGLKV